MPRTRALQRDFFHRHHVDVARDLLGCRLVWLDVQGVIVETEAYAAEDDPACHTSFRPSARAFFRDNASGTAYVYINYGIHWMLNVLTADGIVLLRAVEPTHGIELMQQRRRQQRLSALCSGPGKLGQALGLSGEDHGRSLLSSTRHILPRPRGTESPVIASDVRVGISQGLDRLWRFLVTGNPHVSVPPGQALRKRRELGQGVRSR